MTLLRRVLNKRTVAIELAMALAVCIFVGALGFYSVWCGVSFMIDPGRTLKVRYVDAEPSRGGFRVPTISARRICDRPELFFFA